MTHLLHLSTDYRLTHHEHAVLNMQAPSSAYTALDRHVAEM